MSTSTKVRKSGKSFIRSILPIYSKPSRTSKRDCRNWRSMTMDDKKYTSLQKSLISGAVLPTAARRPTRPAAYPEHWRHWERMEFKLLFWTLPRFILNMRHTPISKTWKSSSIRLLSWIELRDLRPAQTTIWLLPQKTSDALQCRASEAFLQNAENLCNHDQTTAPQRFPAWRPDNSDSKGRWFESSRAYQKTFTFWIF